MLSYTYWHCSFFICWSCWIVP